MKHRLLGLGAWGAALAILGTAYAIALPALYHQSIRLDESQSIWIATKPVPAILRFTAEDVHVPLYNLALHVWTQLLGTDITVVRDLSLVFFVLTLPVLFFLARTVTNRTVAILTVVLFGLSPFVVWYSFEARMYTLLMFAATLTHLAFIRFLRAQGQQGRLVLFLSLILGLYSHYFFLLVPLVQGLYLLSTTIADASVLRKNYRQSWARSLWVESRVLRQYALLGLAALATLVPWLLYVIHQGSASNTQPLIPRPTSFNVLQTYAHFLFGFQSTAIQAALVSLWPLGVMLLFFVFTLKRRVPADRLTYFTLATFLPVGLVFAISFIRPIFLSRYLIFVAPTLFLLLAWMIINFSRRLSVAASVGLLAVMMSLLVHQSISAATPVKEDYRDVAQYLSRTATPRDVIAVSAPFTTYPIEYNYTGNAKITTIPLWNRYVQGPIPPFTEDGLVHQLDDDKQRYAKIYVVLSYDQGYESKIRQYLDTHFALSSHRQFSPDLEVRVYTLRYDGQEHP